MKRAAILLLLIFSGTCFLASQALPPQEPLTPEDYDPEEFPMWAHDLRRYEVIAVGSFPVTFFASTLVYDFSIYASNDFNPAYSMGSQRSSQDIAIIMTSAAITSLLIATVDLIINVNKREKASTPENE